LQGTPKGAIRHLRPHDHAIAHMDEPARPALIVMPRFGFARAVRPVGAAETFVRLSQASTNYVALGEPAFASLTRLVRHAPARAIDYPDATTAIALIDQLWAEDAR